MKQQPPSDAGFGDAGPGSGGAVPGAQAADAPGAAFGLAALPSAPAEEVAVEPGDPVGAWAALGAAARAVATAPLWRLSDDQVAGLLRDQVADAARTEAARLALIRELDTRGWAAAVGATSTQAWLAQALLIDPRTAAADVRAARALDPAGDAPPEPGAPVMTGATRSDADPVLAATGRALADGIVSRAHADAVVASVRALPAHPTTRPDLVPEAEACLLQQCAQFDPPTVRRLGREVLHTVDPSGVLAEELTRAARDELWLTPTPTGRLRLRGEVDQVTGALLTTLVEAGAAPRPSAADGPDARPATTRRAHALAEVLRLAANAAPSVHGGLSPHLLITMTLDTLRSSLGAAAGRGTVAASGDAGGTSGTSGTTDTGVPSLDPRAAEHPALFGAAPQQATGQDVKPQDARARESARQAGEGLNRAQRRAAPKVARRMAVTETGVPLSAATARRLACDATIIPLVLGANSEPLDIGRATRLIPPAIRRALIARDRGCAFPGCRRPPRWCDAHHIKYWADGGETCLENLVLLCGHHHDLIHHSQWTVAIADGRPVFNPPAWLDPTGFPRGPTDPQAA